MTTMETNETKVERRVHVTHEPVPGAKPWRAVLVERTVEQARGATVLTYEPSTIPVGRFDTQHEAATVGVSALRFVNAGLRWVPVGEVQP